MKGHPQFNAAVKIFWNKTILPAILMMTALTGCLNPAKTICIRDSRGEPIKQCMLLAVEAQMLFPNKKGIFYSDQKGQVQIPYRGLVVYYAGKEQYRISSKASVKENVEITIYEESQILPDEIMVSKSVGVPHEHLSEIPLNPMEWNYFASTQVVVFSDADANRPKNLNK